jgi:hypothetical protein
VISASTLACPVPAWDASPCLSTIQVLGGMPGGSFTTLNGSALHFQYTAAWTVVNPRTGPATGGGNAIDFREFALVFALASSD